MNPVATLPATATSPRPTAGRPKVLVLACGALAREFRAVIAADGLNDFVHLECLPASLHNRPSEIPAAVEARLVRAAGRYDQVLIGYADCGTAGALDEVIARWGVERMPGAHCYEFYAGSTAFAALHDAEPGTFYLTDYLVRFFDRWVWQGLWLDRHPELLEAYFGNYTRVVYLSQFPDAVLLAAARDAADRLGLAFEHVPTGTGELRPALLSIGRLSDHRQETTQ